MSSNTLDPGSMNNKSTLEGFFDALLHYFWHLFDLPLTPFFCYRMFVSSLPLSFKLLVFGSKLLLTLNAKHQEVYCWTEEVLLLLQN